MSLILRVLVIFIFFAVVRNAANEVVFVEAQLIDPERPATPRNIRKITVNDQKVFDFRILPVTDDLANWSQKFRDSAMIQRVFELRRAARNLSEGVDKPDTPFLIYVGPDMGLGGPAVASNFRILASGDDGREIRSDSLMVLAPLKVGKSIMKPIDFYNQMYLAPLIAHELFHGIMGDLYGPHMIEMKARSYSRNGHAADRITDEFLAFIEGTAEAMELVALEDHSNEVSTKLVDSPDLSDELRDFVRGFKRKRLVLAKHNKLGFVADGSVLDGELDSAEDMLKTEGVISTLTYRLLFNSGLSEPFQKIFTTMARHKPLHFIDFLKKFVVDHPESRSTVLRQFLESTRYITVHKDSAKLYKDYYLSKKAWKQKKGTIQSKQLASKRWSLHKQDLFEKVLAGEISLDNNLVVSYKIADENFFYNFDLNRVSRIELEDFWNEYFSDDFSEDQCVAMLDLLFQMRSKGVFIKNMDSIDWPQSVEDRLHSMNQFFSQRYNERITEKILSISEGLYKFTELNHRDAFLSTFSHLRSSHLD